MTSLLVMVTGMDLRVERVRARTTATRLALQMGVSRQRVSQIESMAVVSAPLAQRYRIALAALSQRAA